MLTVGLCSSMSYLEQGFLRHMLCFQLKIFGMRVILVEGPLVDDIFNSPGLRVKQLTPIQQTHF